MGKENIVSEAPKSRWSFAKVVVVMAVSFLVGQRTVLERALKNSASVPSMEFPLSSWFSPQPAWCCL